MGTANTKQVSRTIVINEKWYKAKMSVLLSHCHNFPCPAFRLLAFRRSDRFILPLRKSCVARNALARWSPYEQAHSP
jgi:hypothetical protein